MKQGWEVKRLGEVLQKTETVNPIQNPDKEFIYIDVSSVNNESFTIENTTVLKGKDAPSRARKLVKTNDVIFATIRPTLRRMCIISDKYNNQVCSTGYSVLRVKKYIDPVYLFYYLLTDAFNKRMEDLQKGASYPAVTDGEVRGQIIVYPKSLSEQQRIVAILDEAFDSIATAKENTRKNLQNARELFKTYLQSVFSNPGEGWEEKTLGEVAIIKSGGTPLRSDKEYWDDGDIPWYSSGELNGLYTDVSERCITETGLNNSNAKLFPKGSLLVGMYDTAALKMSIIDRDAAFNQAIAGIKPNSELDLIFVLHAINAIKPAILNQRRGVRQKNLSLEKIKSITLCIPPLSEQKSIVAKLGALSAETKKLETIYQQKLADLDELKQSLLHQAFSGQL